MDLLMTLPRGACYAAFCFALLPASTAQAQEPFLQCQPLVDAAALPELSVAPKALPTRDGDKTCAYDAAAQTWTCILAEKYIEGSSRDAAQEGARLKALYEEVGQLAPTCWAGTSVEHGQQRTIISNDEARLTRTIRIALPVTPRQMTVMWAGQVKKVDNKVSQTASVIVALK